MLHWLCVALAAPVATSSTTVDVHVVGPLAELTVTRSFRNDEPLPIDTELWFAIPPGGTIDRVTVTIGARRLTTEVVPRQQAAERYVEAANHGQAATLLEHQADDVAVQRIANVLPGEDIVVELHLVVPVDRNQGVWELAVPLVVAPRLQDPSGEGPIYDVSPPIPGRLPLQDRVDAHLRVETGTPLRWIEASRPFRSRLTSVDGEVWVDETRADGDLVFRWATAAAEPAMSLLVGDGHGLLLIEPPAAQARVEPPAADVVLVVDVSDTVVGARWNRTLAVVEALLAELRDQDTFTLLVFADRVRGIAVRAPADPDTVATALSGLAHTPLGGSTNLALALRFAVAVPTPPERARTVVVVSDGGTDQDLDGVVGPGITVHTVGIGAATNQPLLRALATAGNGVAVTLRPGDPEAALDPVLDGLRGPVLTDVSVRFVVDGAPVDRPLPPLYADRVVTVSERGLDCTTPAIVTGRFVGRPFEEHVVPTCTSEVRPLRVSWARSRLATLSGTEATDLAVAYGLLTPYTSLLGIDATIHNPTGVAVYAPVRNVMVSDVQVMAGAHTTAVVDVDSTRSSNALAEEITVSAAPQPLENDGSRRPEFAGSVAPTGHPALWGTNYVDGRLRLEHLSGIDTAAPLGVDRASGLVSGPVVRDRFWGAASYTFDRATTDERDFLGHAGAVNLTVEPNREHRLGLSGIGAARSLGDVTQDSVSGVASWQWFPASDWTVETVGVAQASALAGDDSRRWQARTSTTGWSVDDPLRGTHELKVGGDLDHTDWTLGGSWARTWLGVVPPAQVDVTRGGLFAQDGYRPVPTLRIDGGARVDVTLGRPWLGPELRLGWDPEGHERTKLAAGFVRTWGHLGCRPRSCRRSSACPATTSGWPWPNESCSTASGSVARPRSVCVPGSRSTAGVVPTNVRSRRGCSSGGSTPDGGPRRCPGGTSSSSTPRRS